MQLTAIHTIEATLELLSGLHIGAGDNEMHIGGTDNPVITQQFVAMRIHQAHGAYLRPTAFAILIGTAAQFQPIGRGVRG